MSEENIQCFNSWDKCFHKDLVGKNIAIGDQQRLLNFTRTKFKIAKGKR